MSVDYNTVYVSASRAGGVAINCDVATVASQSIATSQLSRRNRLRRRNCLVAINCRTCYSTCVAGGGKGGAGGGDSCRRTRPVHVRGAILKASKGLVVVVASRTKVSDSMSRTREERRWWTRPPFSTAICPISLEPLRVLCHPPFCLLANTERPQPCSASDFFDPTVLAAYFVASQRFDHPVSRRALGREEIVSLDEHLVGNDLGEAKRVTAVFDLHQESRDASGPAGVLRLAHFRAEAEQIMQSLFEQRRDRRLSSGSTAAETILPTRTDGNLTIIDDDAPTVEPASDDSASDDFPELPTARLPAQPHQIATSVRPRPTASLVSTMAGLSTRDSEAKTARCSLLADAFERDASGPSTFAASAASRFSPKAVALARARPQLIASVEDRLDGLLDESVHADQRELLPPMTKAEREVVHEMARSCKVATIELEPEPRRCVVLLRTDRSEWPAARLSDVVKLTSPPTPKRSFLPTPACLVSAREARGHHIPEAAPRRVSAQADVWIPALRQQSPWHHCRGEVALLCCEWQELPTIRLRRRRATVRQPRRQQRWPHTRSFGPRLSPLALLYRRRRLSPGGGFDVSSGARSQRRPPSNGYVRTASLQLPAGVHLRSLARSTIVHDLLRRASGCYSTVSSSSARSMECRAVHMNLNLQTHGG